MSNLYKNPITPLTSLGPESVPRKKTFGTDFSVLGIGGYMEVYNLSDLYFTIPTGQTGSIEISGNTIPIQFFKSNGSPFSFDTLTLGSDNISSGRRRLGMLVYVYENDQIYQFHINNYDTLWNNATGATGVGGSTVVISDFGTTVKGNSPEGIAFISAWTENTIEGVSGGTSNSAWRKLVTGGGSTSFTGGTVSGNTIFLQGVTGSTFSATTYYGDGSNLTNIPDTYVTGGTYSSGIATFKNNTGGTFNVVGFLSADTYVTGGTYSSGIATFTNNTGGTFDVTGFISADTYVTGLTFNNANYDLTITRNDGVSFTDSLSILASDLTVTGGTYNSVTGVATFTNNTGGTFQVSGFITGFTDTNIYNSNGSLSGNRILNNNNYSLTFSGLSQNILTIVGSGSTQPIFKVQGSSGELFSVTDSLVGSLFSVNDISGLPVLEVFSDNTILMGSYQSPSLNTTIKKTANAGTTNIYSIPTSAYTGAFFDYTVNDGTNLRAGNIMSIWSGTSVNFTETSTTDFGNTSGITFNMIVSGGTSVLQTSATTSNWVVKTIVRSI